MNDKINEIKEKNIVKVGRITLGIIMILFGASMFMQLVVKVNIIKYILMLWPVVLIALGIEILYYNQKKEITLKYDVAGIILTFMILIFGSIFSYINLGINTVLYNTDNNNVVSDLVDNERIYDFSGKAKINNLTDMPVSIRIQEDKDFDGTNVKARLKYSDKFNPSIVSLVNDKYSIYKIVDINYNVENDNNSTKRVGKLSIIDKPEWVDSIELIITTSNKDNVEILGNIKVVE